MTELKIPDVSTLRLIKGISELSDDRLIALANQLRVCTAKNKQLLIEAGSTENSSLFIIKGKVSLNALDGKSRIIAIDENEALKPVAQLRPSIYDVKALGKVDYLKIEKQKLFDLAQLSEEAANDISVHSLFTDYDEEDKSIVNNLYRNLMDNSIQLPSLPSVAGRVQQLYNGKYTDVNSLAQVLISYPDVSRKIFNIARCANNDDMNSAEKVRYSIRRLGILAVYCLIMVYAVGKLVNRLPRHHMQRINSFWEHCLNVAAISRILAKKNKLFSPDLAMLAGLIHGIGVLVIDDELLEHNHLMLDHLEIDHAIQIMRPEISSLLLRRWNFGDDLILVAEECGDWTRNHKASVDLCDLVLVSNYYGMLKSDKNYSLPLVSSIPAVGKLGITPEEIIIALRESITVKRNIKKIFA
ncbi:MAG: HDOD domain-containing protein [Gammaproteobacteria bacterium]|nr:HDOD domain-containing protein [Gammaproteobacteria bacterium]